MVKELAVTLADGPKYVVISIKTSKGNTDLTKLLSAVINIAKAQPRCTMLGQNTRKNLAIDQS